MNVLITGAGRGIGLLVAQQLAMSGHRVFAGVRDVESVRQRPGAETAGITLVELDVTRRDTIEAAVDEVISAAGGLDGLVNNAGISNL